MILKQKQRIRISVVLCGRILLFDVEIFNRQCNKSILIPNAN